MRKVSLLMHVSLDGFVATRGGAIDWIAFDEAMGDFADQVVSGADTVIYGRTTYEMMVAYWPTAGDSPNASRHDVNHAKWVNAATKVIVSSTLQKVNWNNWRIIRNNLAEEVNKLKMENGKDIVVIGSASIAHQLMQHDLIDDYWLNINPVVLGDGLPFAKNIGYAINLALVDSTAFSSGVVGLHYEAKKKSDK